MTPFDELPDWLTVTEYAEQMRVSKRQVYRWIADGTIPAAYVRRQQRTTRIHRDTLRLDNGVETASNVHQIDERTPR